MINISKMKIAIVHRLLTDIFAKRGVKLERTYQFNTGDNTNFTRTDIACAINRLSPSALNLPLIYKGIVKKRYQ